MRGAPQGWPLWAGCFGIALATHLGLAALVLAREAEPAEGAPGDVVNIDLAPEIAEASAPQDEVAGPQTDDAPTPSETQDAGDPEPPAPDAPPPAVAEEKPLPPPPELTLPEVPPVPEAAVVLPPTPEKPPEPPPELKPLDPPPEVPPPDQALKELQPRDTQESQARAPSAAALSGGRRPNAAGEQTWRGAIGVHLGKSRRYPAEARDRGLQGTATVRVSIDGEGRVLGRELVKGSGQPLLDQEALAMVLRAQPLPRPPATLATPIILTVPVRFSIR